MREQRTREWFYGMNHEDPLEGLTSHVEDFDYLNGHYTPPPTTAEYDAALAWERDHPLEVAERTRAARAAYDWERDHPAIVVRGGVEIPVRQAYRQGPRR
jgi:hypothetical protein